MTYPLAVALLLGTCLGLASGGSMGGLTSLKLRGEILILALFVVQAFVRSPRSASLGEFEIALWAACGVLLSALAWANREVPGLLLISVGSASNSLVVLLNSGMPAFLEKSPSTIAASVDAYHGFYLIADSRTIAPVLGDVLPMANGLASLGDVLLMVGVLVCITAGMAKQRSTPRAQLCTMHRSTGTPRHNMSEVESGDVAGVC